MRTLTRGDSYCFISELLAEIDDEGIMFMLGDRPMAPGFLLSMRLKTVMDAIASGKIARAKRQEGDE